MLGIIHTLCRGVLYFLLLGYRLYSVWDLPIFFRLRLVSLRVVHDVSRGLLIFSVVVYYISCFCSAIFCMGLAYLFKTATGFGVVHDVCWGLLTFSVVVYYISYFWNFGYILYGGDY